MPLVFANPWMLLALSAAALPVIIHLISRQRARKLPISTLRFLFQTDRKTARKHKLVDLLVLILRTALLAFLALALSKPFLQPHRKAGELAPGRTDWAIVLDDSYSMGLVQEGLTVFDKAVAAVTEILKAIPQGDQVFVILASGRRPEGLKGPTYRIRSLIESLNRLDGPSYSDASVGSAIEEGLKFLSASTHPNRALVLASDFQERALRDALASLGEKEKIPKRTAVYWLDVGLNPESNTAVESVRVHQAMPFVGMPMYVRAAVANHGKAPAHRTVSLWIGGGKIESREVDVAPESVSEVEFEYIPLRAGNLAGEVRLSGDPLPADNRRFFCWHLAERLRVAVIHGGEAGARARWDDVFFLRSVLEPVAENSKKGRSNALSVNYFDTSAAGAVRWDDYRIVFVVGAGRIGTTLAAKLKDFARRGGSVIAFGGSGDETAGPASPDDPDVVLLGVAPGEIRTETAQDDHTLALGRLDDRHPIFRTLARTAARNLSVIEFYAHRRVVASALRGDSRVVAAYDNGDPFLIERRLGDGRILVFETRCHPDWSNLPVRPLFLPLIYETMKYCVVSQLGVPEDLAPLATLRCKLPEGSQFTRAMVKDPDGRLRSYPLGKGKKDLVTEVLEKPGIYHIYLQAGEKETELIAAVNVNPDEGRIVRLNDDEVGKKLAAAHGRVFSSPRLLAGTLRRQRQGVALGGFFLYLAAACFLAESFLANFLIPRRRTREAATPPGPPTGETPRAQTTPQ